MIEPLIIGMDADVQRIAYAVCRGSQVSGARTIQRANTKRRIEKRYHQELVGLVRWASQRGAIIYLEGIYLAGHKGDYTKTNVDGFRRLANVQGEITYECERHSVPLEIVSPSTWQSQVLGITRGREAIKAASLRHASTFVANLRSDHEADAVCVALYGAMAEALQNA